MYKRCEDHVQMLGRPHTNVVKTTYSLLADDTGIIETAGSLELSVVSIGRGV